MKKILAVTFISIIFIKTGAQKKDFVVTIKTNYGEMIAILYDETPKHKQNFIKLAKEHYFDSLLFHRVIQNFMIQGGDPNSKKAKSGESLGNGGPGYTIDAEFNSKLFHKKGALAAARLGDGQNPTKASSGSQFYIVQGKIIPQAQINSLRIDQAKLNSTLSKFISKSENKSIYDTLSKLYGTGKTDAFNNKIISLADQVEKETGVKILKDISQEKIKAYTTVGGTPHLDDGYTVFGEVIKGLDVIDKIAAVKTAPGDRPTEDIRMFVSIKEMSKKKIKKEYGYIYPVSSIKK
ncbi:MAG TPA: peptidylprolyl isomerase [Cytophagales bacterium]|jgi:peptidyl-prolyl cis-trans isomerase B (cyclophilin B)|nr:peptidylprolyl isomerase [Cytophagales bacterium]